MEAALQQIAELLYGQPRTDLTVAVRDVRASLRGLTDGDVDHGIRMMHDRGLLRIRLAGDAIELSAAGKKVFEKGCVPNVCLGRTFVAGRYRAAIKHLAVRNREGDESGGTAFFCADFPNWIATARHLVTDGHELLRIENEDGTVVAQPPFALRATGGTTDLALVQCQMPPAVNPLRIDWDTEAVKELDEVLVVGYPPIAHHAPALVFSEGEVASLARRQRGDRYSIIISRITEPGYSGGPVISSAGLVVGVIEQENVFQRKDGNPSVFNGATPIHYFRELL